MRQFFDIVKTLAKVPGCLFGIILRIHTPDALFRPLRHLPHLPS